MRRSSCTSTSLPSTSSNILFKLFYMVQLGWLTSTFFLNNHQTCTCLPCSPLPSVIETLSCFYQNQNHPNHGNHQHPSFSLVETLPCLKENLRCFIGATSLDSSEQSLLVVIVGGGAGVGAVQHLSSLLFTIDLTDNSSVQISGGRTTSGNGRSKKTMSLS